MNVHFCPFLSSSFQKTVRRYPVFKVPALGSRPRAFSRRSFLARKMIPYPFGQPSARLISEKPFICLQAATGSSATCYAGTSNEVGIAIIRSFRSIGTIIWKRKGNFLCQVQKHWKSAILAMHPSSSSPLRERLST